MIKIEGLHGVSATILADSISPQGIRLLTMEIEYPRMILAEQNTHGMLCKNSASSRAIPFKKMAEQLTARPIRFGEANPGMQDKGVDYTAGVLGWPVEYDGNTGSPLFTPEEAWQEAKEHALYFAEAFYNAGYHKQVYNRLTEPFQMMKTVISGTELENYFWLRNHDAADPSIAELARCMFEAREQSIPDKLSAGQYHLPYVMWIRDYNGNQVFYDRNADSSIVYYTLEQAIKVSCARCAAVSFRNEDYGLEKCLEVYDRLVGDERKHASAFQHQATPMKDKDHGSDGNNYPFQWRASVNVPEEYYSWEPGVSHADRKGQLWSAQFKGWIMQRKLIPGENYEG